MLPLRDRLFEAAVRVAGACTGLQADAPDDVLSAYRALRGGARASDLLYPIADRLKPLSRFFLERELDEAVADRVVAACAQADLEGRSAAEGLPRGLVQIDNEEGSRGGYALYVPEWVPEDRPLPLVVALHGGSGHGRDFVHAWLREARTRGCVLLAPTSRDRTWSFAGMPGGGAEDADADALFDIVRRLDAVLPLDAERRLLTGMSDGATYSLLTGLREDAPFTHLAPFSGVVAPQLQFDGRIVRARGLPVRLVHGALDWMFDVERAREGALMLEGAGAKLDYVEIEDLSHTVAREEHARTLDWLGVGRPTLADVS